MLRLIELDQFTGNAPLLRLKSHHQLAVQIEERLHAFLQNTLVPLCLDHGLVDSMAALGIQVTNGSPIPASERIAQGIAGGFKKLDG